MDTLFLMPDTSA